MSSFDDIVAIVECHRRRWKPFPSLTISLTKSLRVAGSLDLQCQTQSVNVGSVLVGHDWWLDMSHEIWNSQTTFLLDRVESHEIIGVADSGGGRAPLWESLKCKTAPLTENSWYSPPPTESRRLLEATDKKNSATTPPHWIASAFGDHGKMLLLPPPLNCVGFRRPQKNSATTPPLHWIASTWHLTRKGPPL